MADFSFIDDVFDSSSTLQKYVAKSPVSYGKTKNSLIKNFEKLVLEVIGEDEPENGLDMDNATATLSPYIRNPLRADQRKALESMLSKSEEEQ